MRAGKSRTSKRSAWLLRTMIEGRHPRGADSGEKSEDI
jgi:hypothetical protein